MTPAMNFEVALDLLIATAITCLRHDNPKLRRALEIAINYRELFPTTPPAISLQQLELLGAWLSSKPTGRGVLLQSKEDAMMRAIPTASLRSLLFSCKIDQ
jgi:hypothetical protein